MNVITGPMFKRRWHTVRSIILISIRHMKVVPVPFSTEGKNMLIHTKELLEFETPIVAINPKFEKLTTSLRTAISDDLGKVRQGSHIIR